MYTADFVTYCRRLGFALFAIILTVSLVKGSMALWSLFGATHDVIGGLLHGTLAVLVVHAWYRLDRFLASKQRPHVAVAAKQIAGPEQGNHKREHSDAEKLAWLQRQLDKARRKGSDLNHIARLEAGIDELARKVAQQQPRRLVTTLSGVA